MYFSVSEEHLGKMNMQKKPLNKPLLKAGQCSAGSLKRNHCQLQFLQSEKFIAVGATCKNQGAFYGWICGKSLCRCTFTRSQKIWGR